MEPLAEVVACLVLCRIKDTGIRAAAVVIFQSHFVIGLALLLKTEEIHELVKERADTLLKQVPCNFEQF